jgi:hypothetical protein
LRDRWGRVRADYGLADVFGVRYVGTRESGRTSFGAAPQVTYRERRYFDEVVPTSGKVGATWEDGRPAVVVNAFGRGRCMFVAARDLGNCCNRKKRGHDGPRWYLETHKQYWPGVREFLSGLVIEGLEQQGAELPFTVGNCPPYVETVMRVQDTDGGMRRLLHLLNYSFNEPVTGVEIEMPAAPEEGAPRVFYPEDGHEAEARVEDGRLHIAVRDFNVHELIVVEP